MSLISSALIVPERSPLIDCARSAEASTVTTSSTPPTPRTMGGIATRSVAVSTIPFSSWVLKPVNVTRRSYVPANRFVNTNSPWASVMASRVTAVAVLRTVTEAPGMAPLLPSMTEPPI